MKIKTNQLHFSNTLKALWFFNLMLFTTITFAQVKDYSEVITKKAAKIKQKVIDWRHDIHQNPEWGIENFVPQNSLLSI